jgi:hypothetical protein
VYVKLPAGAWASGIFGTMGLGSIVASFIQGRSREEKPKQPQSATQIPKKKKKRQPID